VYETPLRHYAEVVKAIVHVVLVEWLPVSTVKQRESARAQIRNLAIGIPGIISLVEGPSVSTENLEHGFEYGFVITFSDGVARDAYLPHPEHRVVADLLGALAARIVVYDIETAADAPRG